MQSIRGLFAIPFLVAAGAPAACDFPVPHAIDLAYAAAVERSGGVTAALRDAQGEAWEGWDAELNRLYAELRQATPAPAHDILRNAQRAWLAFDTAQTQWDIALRADAGSAAALDIADAALARRRARVCELDDDLQRLRVSGDGAEE